ncbi:unnamed protein product [Schistosoma mattheei]|uniref:Uncharacterized protein n=1 Tax=Schistosoma mattheei TaxID=31246 RepID=A0A183PS42_9TREM|nr:unnamed protein product [Schistosoma mattheei]
MLLYSGHEEENAPHTQGIALMLSKEARNALVGWESHGSRTIKASRIRKGADIASDHHLVVVKIKLKRKKYWTIRKQRYECSIQPSFLRGTNKLNEFKIALHNRFQALQDLLKEEETAMEDHWKRI